MFSFRRFRRWLKESDEERLSDEVRDWAEGVPGATSVKVCAARGNVKVAGVVRRLRIRPGASFEAVISDGTGEVTAVWTGRENIPGLMLGSRLTLEGMLATERGGPRMVNPRYEFAA